MVRHLICLATICLFFAGCVDNADSAQVQAQTPDPKYKIDATADSGSPTGIYIPKDLDDSFVELENMLHPDFVKEFADGTEDDVVKHHFGLGRWLRNNWGLWSGSRLAKWFNAQGIRHPDDMSAIILDSFWRHLNKKPVKFRQQIEYYQNYWNKQLTIQQQTERDK